MDLFLAAPAPRGGPPDKWRETTWTDLLCMVAIFGHCPRVYASQVSLMALVINSRHSLYHHEELQNFNVGCRPLPIFTMIDGLVPVSSSHVHHIFGYRRAVLVVLPFPSLILWE